jgi:hypothetical protein
MTQGVQYYIIRCLHDIGESGKCQNHIQMICGGIQVMSPRKGTTTFYMSTTVSEELVICQDLTNSTYDICLKEIAYEIENI